MHCFIRAILIVMLSSFSLFAGDFLAKEALKAQKDKKLLLVTVSSDRCPYCIKMRKDVFENTSYKSKIAQKYIHVEVMHNDIALPTALHAKYLPTNYILSPKDLKVLDEFAGYIEPKHFLELLEEVYQQEVK